MEGSTRDRSVPVLHCSLKGAARNRSSVVFHRVVKSSVRDVSSLVVCHFFQEGAVAGGVSANSGLRAAFEEYSRRYGWKIHIPKFAYTTDNAAMVAISGYYKYLKCEFCGYDVAPYARVEI